MCDLLAPVQMRRIQFCPEYEADAAMIPLWSRYLFWKEKQFLLVNPSPGRGQIFRHQGINEYTHCRAPRPHLRHLGTVLHRRKRTVPACSIALDPAACRFSWCLPDSRLWTNRRRRYYHGGPYMVPAHARTGSHECTSAQQSWCAQSHPIHFFPTKRGYAEETGASSAWFCSRRHNFGMIKNIQICLVSLDRPFLSSSK